jgi:hypothetical protein
MSAPTTAWLCRSEEQVKPTLKTLIVTLACGLVGAGASPAFAKGCVKGAVVGGVAGHMAGHGALGAAGGCAIGHHMANKAERTTNAHQSSSQSYTQDRH